MANWLPYRQLGRFPIFVCDVIYHYPWKCYYRDVLHEKTTSLSILPVKYPSLMKIMHCRNSLSNELSNLHLTKLSTVTDVIHKISPSC